VLSTVCLSRAQHAPAYFYTSESMTIFSDRCRLRKKGLRIIRVTPFRIIQNGAETRNRTRDTRIFSPVLYHLSYLGMENAVTILKGQDLVKLFVVGH
jgi:hypothetical protein